MYELDFKRFAEVRHVEKQGVLFQAMDTTMDTTCGEDLESTDILGEQNFKKEGTKM